MFGYIVLSSNAEKDEKKTYRSFYCGLCHTLKEKYGKDGMMCLSYDMTFLTLLLSDLDGEKVTEGEERCPVHPLKAHRYFTTPIMDYTSSMQILLSYYSLIDSIHDEGKGRDREKKLRPYVEEIEKKYPRQAEAVRKNLAVITEYEKTEKKNPEFLALTFGNLLGEIFVYDETSFFRNDLFLLGCSLGKFIYLLDGWDDRKKDRKKGNYNPFEENVTADEVKSMLLDAASGAGESAGRLPLDEYNTIIDNILYSGMWTKFREERKGGKE